MLKKYFKTYYAFIENAFSYEAQYRGDTMLKLVSNILWVAMMFITIEIIFSKTSDIMGWTKPEIYLMTVLWIMADELYITFFGDNVSNITDIIADGDLDMFLTKPISTLFLISCKKISLRGFMRFLMQVPILVWLIWRFDFAVSPSAFVLCILLVGAAILIDYSRVLIGNTMGFWFNRVDNINELIGAMSALGKYPLSIWPKTLKIIFLTALPVAFSGFMPVATLVGKWPWYGVVYGFVFCAIIMGIAVAFWNYALRRYTSASS